MNLDEVKTIYDLFPNSKLILTHLDSVNHALVTSEDVRKFVEKNNMKNALTPKNGEWMKF